MQQLDALGSAGDEEAHDYDVHQRHLVQVEHEPRAVPPDCGPLFVQVLRLKTTGWPFLQSL
jgi:hypothetical protein